MIKKEAFKKKRKMSNLDTDEKNMRKQEKNVKKSYV